MEKIDIQLHSSGTLLLILHLYLLSAYNLAQFLPTNLAVTVPSYSVLL